MIDVLPKNIRLLIHTLSIWETVLCSCMYFLIAAEQKDRTLGLLQSPYKTYQILFQIHFYAFQWGRPDLDSSACFQMSSRMIYTAICVWNKLHTKLVFLWSALWTGWAVLYHDCNPFLLQGGFVIGDLTHSHNCCCTILLQVLQNRSVERVTGGHEAATEMVDMGNSSTMNVTAHGQVCKDFVQIFMYFHMII